MPPPNHVKLGLRTREILEGSALFNCDEFPAHQVWADEIEQVLQFLVEQQQYDRLLPRLRAKERDATLAEARAAYHFHHNGFRIVQWEPEAIPGLPGDLEIDLPDTHPLFVEVKCPRWEGELAEEEIRSGRTKRPKYINADVHSIDPAERILFVTGKALPKFASERVNIVVVVDDLFVSPLDTPRFLVADRLAREFVHHRYVTVSGVYLLNPVVYHSKVEYRTGLIVGRGRGLPGRVRERFEASCTWPSG